MAKPDISTAGKLKPPSETFSPGDWFLGSIPPNLDVNKPPIVFVQGKNGSSTSWYGETDYHGINDMYTKAYEAGYQTVFVQLYDSAGNGSASQYDNGRLLASMLEEISTHFGGEKVNVIAHSKGGPDTQAALVHYGAHQYVGRIITLASPHHGSHLADLAYSWYAGWLGSLLGQKDDGTYSLQVGKMAEFRSATDNHVNSRKNMYFTVTGMNRGPALSALSMGGQYLSTYGENDGLVNVWSSKIPYASHLFTDPNLDHDNIRVGSAVFPRIEPYLRSASTVELPSVIVKYKQQVEDDVITTALAQTVLGGELQQNIWNEQSFHVNEAAPGMITIYTASKDVEVELISPSNKRHSPSVKVHSAKNEASFFNGATIQTFNGNNLEIGDWRVRMKTKSPTDAYLLTAQFNEKNPITLSMPGKVKQKDAKFLIKNPINNKKGPISTTFMVHLLDESGNEINEKSSIQVMDKENFSGTLPDVPKSGVYNVTIDVMEKSVSGAERTRTLIRSVYIEK
ncbi:MULTISPECIES: alpha/beta fold hydrolase [unclassified Peribacillus]|uniref:esterase/lipase family protein n=1 Tax=unclassified Peribacillus TaxID=2675266 RepID=UPI0033A47B7B